MRISLAVFGFAMGSILFSAGCSQKLGTMDIETDGEFSGLMYKNCGCGCTAIVDIESDDPFNAGGKEGIGAETSIDINVPVGKK